MDDQKQRSSRTGHEVPAGTKRIQTGAEGATEFTGYENYADRGEIINIGGDRNNCSIVLDRTPFYAESGGQIFDTGYLYNSDGSCARVFDVKKVGNVFVHKTEIENGDFMQGDVVDAVIATSRRNMIAVNHSATHLLHKALQEVLGEHVKQAGSSVNAESLRFDFSHFQSMIGEEIQKVEEIVNDKITLFLPVETRVMTAGDAMADGAVALFGEKYGEEVRVVSMGDFSKELCGGTHITNTGEIGAFKIISEVGIASGVRRIEAITGQEILKRYISDETLIRIQQRL